MKNQHCTVQCPVWLVVTARKVLNVSGSSSQEQLTKSTSTTIRKQSVTRCDAVHCEQKFLPDPAHKKHNDNNQDSENGNKEHNQESVTNILGIPRVSSQTFIVGSIASSTFQKVCKNSSASGSCSRGSSESLSVGRVARESGGWCPRITAIGLGPAPSTLQTCHSLQLAGNTDVPQLTTNLSRSIPPLGAYSYDDYYSYSELLRSLSFVSHLNLQIQHGDPVD